MRLIILTACLLCSNLVHAQDKPETETEAINTMMDQWHVDAAAADFDGYFGALHEQGRFLGTDKTERWSKQEFMNYARSGFEKKKTWDFKPSGRIIFFSDDLKYAWFDEVLDTWMGPCRGSAIVKNTNEGWKIMQYNLAILVDNDKVQDYLKLIMPAQKEN